MSEELKVIYLQPECCVDPEFGRVWCEHDSPEPCPDGKHWTKYAIIPEGFALVPTEGVRNYVKMYIDDMGRSDATEENIEKHTKWIMDNDFDFR